MHLNATTRSYNSTSKADFLHTCISQYCTDLSMGSQGIQYLSDQRLDPYMLQKQNPIIIFGRNHFLRSQKPQPLSILLRTITPVLTQIYWNYSIW